MYIYIYIYKPTYMHNNNVVLRNILILLSPASPMAHRHLCVDLTTNPDCLAGDMPTHKTSDRHGV